MFVGKNAINTKNKLFVAEINYSVVFVPEIYYSVVSVVTDQESVTTLDKLLTHDGRFKDALTFGYSF